MSDSATAAAATLGAIPPPPPIAGTSYNAGLVQSNIRAIDTLSAQKDAAQAPIYAKMKQDYSRDRLNFDKAAENYKPIEEMKPAPTVPENDPLKGFGSAAAVFATIASAFTHTPAINAMNGMAAAVNATKANDWKAYEAGYKQWKENTELAIQHHKLQAEDMKNAMEMMQTDLSTGMAMAKAVAAQTEDKIATRLLETGQLEELSKVQMERQRTSASMAEAGARVQELHLAIAEKKQQIEQQQNLNIQAKEISAEPDPDKRAAMMQQVKIAAEVRNPSLMLQDERINSGGTSPQAIALHRYLQQYPNATGEDIKTFMAKTPESSLSPDARKAAAESHMLTGVMPAGTRNKTDVDAVLNEEAKLKASNGVSTSDLVSNQAGFKAGSQSLANLTKLSDASDAQKAAASKELDLVQSLIPAASEKIDSQAISKWVQTGQVQFGDTELPKYQAALISALDEYAKIINGSTGAAGSTDAARAQAAMIIPAGATSDQIKGIIETIKQGMDYKTQSYGNQIEQIKQRISGAATQPTSPAEGSSSPPVPNARKAPDGKWYVPDPARQGKYLMVQ